MGVFAKAVWGLMNNSSFLWSDFVVSVKLNFKLFSTSLKGGWNTGCFIRKSNLVESIEPYKQQNFYRQFWKPYHFDFQLRFKGIADLISWYFSNPSCFTIKQVNTCAHVYASLLPLITLLFFRFHISGRFITYFNDKKWRKVGKAW